MLRFVTRSSLLLVCCAFVACTLFAQQTPKVTLETSETLFSVATAMNACGYDQELNASEPVRAQVRAEVARAADNSARARASLQDICVFYRDHKQADSARDLAQYVSLALNLGEPPAFAPVAKEADLPPDAGYVLGFVPLLQRFYINTDLHQIWERHKAEYDAEVERSHETIANMLLTTDVYLKMPVSGYVGRRLTVYVEPMAAPGQINSRNYAADYYMVMAPDHGKLRIDTIRHTYLHFILDPITAKRGSTMKRLEPLLSSVKTAPMDDAFKSDITLLVNESLIRAIEARTAVAGKTKEAEAKREKLAQNAATEGFILAPYFEQSLSNFEKTPESLKDAFPDWLHDLDVAHERKRASDIMFASSVAPESMHGMSQPKPVSLLDTAEMRMSSGDLKRAQELAQQALDSKQEDPARAYFLLAQIATMGKDLAGAQTNFERALTAAHEPHLIAWSHIYLGRICDLQEEREAAVQHYHAALEAGDGNPKTRAAAERGIQQPYAPPSARQQEPQEEQ